MSSRRRIESSRRNGAKSRGPITPEGREHSRQSALTHGLAACETVVLSNESKEQFNEMFAYYVDLYSPQNIAELHTIEELVVGLWRQRRLWTLERSTYELEMLDQRDQVEAKYQQINESGRTALANRSLHDKSNVMVNLSRYESRHRKAIKDAKKSLDALARHEENLEQKSELEKTADPSPRSEHPIN